MKSILQVIASQKIMRVIRHLLLSNEPIHLRELASRTGLSPGGVSDILARLKKAGVIREERVGNRRCIALDLTAKDRSLLELFFTEYEYRFIEERVAELSQKAAERLAWMDETYAFYQSVKGRE